MLLSERWLSAESCLAIWHPRASCLPKKLSVGPGLKICWFAVTWVCCFEYTRPVGISFFSFWDGKDSINSDLLHLNFELFASLHSFCLLLLQYTHCHYEFSLLKSTQSTISRLAAPWNLVPTDLSPSFVPVDEMMS